MSEIEVNAALIKGFTAKYIAVNYNELKPIPPFHMEMWDLCCSDAPKVAIAAPRKHAKSTAITCAYILATLLFRAKSFCLLVSDTEGQAAEFLATIKAELQEGGNELLRQDFGVKKLLKETETNLICLMNDGHKFRITAKGSEQKVRGIKWGHKRPDLIVGDDLENDEIVMSPERREKFRRWFMNALIPCGSDNCSIRIVGTILHLDSMLNRRMDDPTWKQLFYAAEDGNFNDVLWPEKFSEETLREIYGGYLADGNPEGYAQEYRNEPVAIENAFFNADYFYDFERDANGKAILPNLENFAAADFAISEKEKADFNVQIVGGMCPEGLLYIRDVKRFKGDSDRIIDELIATQRHWKPNTFTFETAKIDKAIGPSLNREMLRQHVFLNIHKETPSQSKTMRASSIQAMHKAGAIRYDKQASWYPAFEAELLMVADSGPRGRHDDQFDAFGFLGLTIDQFWEAQSDEEVEEEEYELAFEEMHSMGRNPDTGY
jgi:predicted phage terminase large subunit-like protein